MADVIRMSAPENIIRPFLERADECYPLLSLVLEKENLTQDAKSFIKELFTLGCHCDKITQQTKMGFSSLSSAALISAREQEVLRFLSLGDSTREIAGKLSLSESTIKSHISHIYSKLGVNNRIQAITCAQKLELV